jgi:hypothetical protein
VRLKFEVIRYITANHLTALSIYLTQYSAFPDTSVVAYHAKTSRAVMETDHCTHVIPINLMWSNIPVLTCVLCNVSSLVSLHYCTAILGCGRYTVLLVSEVVGGERRTCTRLHMICLLAVVIETSDTFVVDWRRSTLWRGRFNLKNKNGPRGDASVLPLKRSKYPYTRHESSQGEYSVTHDASRAEPFVLHRITAHIWHVA